ncbi:alpha/beta fold hydrolase [Clostridium taeniosporum]|uniref:Alpha/beta hydrolase n=1 Tax=Clostridium taeniosporum TaxID=394958 RepID=A0A1D7XKX2_9CLOT|nr:alpha/beta hydrolase [Clostridium taeniosporum]AOR24003.1 alpha/beta hydrolase [Clostridium taeniosporum]
MICKVKDININYEIIGEGKPIIMLHGYCVDHRLMTGCMENIFEKRKGYKRIYVDLPGMGKSDSAKWIINCDVMLDILIEFINEIIPNENFLIIGQSYGGYISRGIVYKMIDKVDGVILICPVIKPDKKNRNVPEHVVVKKDKVLLSKLSFEEAKEINNCLVTQNEEIYKRYKNEVLEPIRIGDVEFLKNFQEEGYELSFDVDKLNKKFEKPVLILLGKQDSCVGYKDAWSILDNFARGTFAVLDGSGHNLQIEQSEVFNSLVSEWLNKVDEL